MPEDSAKKWRRRSDARPGELTAAAFALFAEQGFAATRLEDVAARAGVSKATIYRYFDNKDALFEAVIKEAISPRFAEAEMLVEAFQGTTFDLLRTFFQVVRGVLAGPLPAVLKMVVSEAGTFPQLARLWVDLGVSRVTGLVRRIVERGIARGEFRDVDVDAVVPLIGAPMFLLGIWKQTFSQTSLQFDPERVLDQHVDMLLRGLAKQSEEVEVQ
ncbi:MAG TPA: TetR/AcrR family transcriptional regulator [Polyangiaceae bacterium]|nr:TetR/AcrR family transcriptional regulator [Polyangiaceae bacterium]